MVIHVDCDETERDAFAPERLLDLSPSATSYWDRDLRCRHANPACRDWLGVVQSFRGGESQRQGLVRYVPDLRRSRVRGLLLQVGVMPPVVWSTR